MCFWVVGLLQDGDVQVFLELLCLRLQMGDMCVKEMISSVDLNIKTKIENTNKGYNKIAEQEL